MLKRNLELSFTVNGKAHDYAEAPSDMHLGHFLREVLGLTGTRIGCSIGECRACTVMVEHAPGQTPVTKQACMISLRHVDGWRITTVEGLAPEGELHPVQKAILEEDALQCGYCATGFAVAGAVACAQIAARPQQDVDALVEAVTGHNLCRCTGYGRYRRAITRAVSEQAARQPVDSAQAPSTLGAPLQTALSPATQASLHYQPLFADARLELIRLLRDAAEIEHSLLVQYLYAAFSVRLPRYAALAGWPSHRYGGRPLHLLGVAIEEMIHLDVVNGLLVELGAAPHLGRQQFPYEQDIYPFPFRLEPLSLATVAKYVYVEASARHVDPDAQATPEDHAFVRRLYEVLDASGAVTRPNQVGSLYRKIEAVLEQLEQQQPDRIDFSLWRKRLLDVREEGESEHFQFFRSLFDGTHQALDGPQVWIADNPDYPSIALSVTTGLPRPGETIPDALLPALRHLGNLHYWATCMLLDQSYRRGGRLHNAARRHMTGPMRSVASALADFEEGLPFDVLPSGYAPGADDTRNLDLLKTMLTEIDFAEERFAAHLPFDYARRCALETAQELSTLDG